MALVGNPIITARSHIPDVAPTLPAPSATVTVVSASGSTLTPGTYAAVVTQRNPWGETAPSSETTGLVVGPNQGIQVVTGMFPSTTAVRIYLTLPGGAAGTEIQFSESSQGTFTMSSPATGAGSPPSQSSSYLPDSDGNMFSAATLYSWLNEGLKNLSRAVGGILDYCGVPTVSGQPLYVCPGQWLQIIDVWYGGYWIQGGKAAEFFRRNAVTSQVLQAVTVSIFSDKQVIEVSYQPDRNSGVCATSGTLTASATSINLSGNNPNVFLLPFGFVQIGTEICAYANVTTSAITGLIRGIGGTSAQAWPNATTVTELSLFWRGKRILEPGLQPGSGLSTLPCPSGWDTILPLYLQAKAKMSEQDMTAADALMKQFYAEAKEWLQSATKPPSFVQVGGNARTITYDQTVAGGIILPS